MIVTGYYHKGKIELPKEYQNLDEGTPVRVEIVDEENELVSLHPEVQKLVKRIRTTLGDAYAYQGALKPDKEIFADALEEAGKYGK